MDKSNLKNYLKVIVGELKRDMDWEEGSFDETAINAFKKALTCKDILCKDSKSIMIQFNESIFARETDGSAAYVWIDGVVQDYYNPSHVLFKTSDEDDIFNTELCDIERKYIIKIIEQIIELC